MKTNMGKSRILFLALAAIVIAGVAVAIGRQPEASTAAETSTSTTAPATVDTAKALEARTLGDANAPITINEYASLTCSHCAHFSTETFDKLKEKYIDTGKVRFIFNDFPLNAPAMEASMVARCLPHDRYFQFIKFLFETQEQWAFSPKYSDSLKQNAKLLGLGEEDYTTCTSNEKMKTELVTRMQTAAKEHSIDATPTFIITAKPGSEQKISGAQPLDAFSKVIDPLLEGK
ncbi:MAG TPA: DsbA family protein [Alphaproteobacteria bacterium]